MFDPPQPSGLLWCCFFRSTTAASTAAAATRSSLYYFSTKQYPLQSSQRLTSYYFAVLTNTLLFLQLHCILQLWTLYFVTDCVTQSTDRMLPSTREKWPLFGAAAFNNASLLCDSEAEYLSQFWSRPPCDSLVLTANPLSFPWCFWRNQRKLLRVVGQPFKLCVEFLLAIFLSLINLHGSSTRKYFGFELVVCSREVFCIYIVIKHLCVWLACFS